MRSDRRMAGVAVSTGVVLAPAGGAGAAGWQAIQLVRSGAAVSSGTHVLLLLACLGAATVLLWATAAAVAGVREGWRAVRGTGAGAPRSPGRGGHVVAAAVTAVVVAALSAGPATAATGGPPGVVVTMTSPGSEPSPGTWGALAEPASTSARTGAAPSPTAVEPFRAPRTVDPASAALVTGTPTRPAAGVEAEVVVHAGDTLWALAAEHLGPGATDDEVARAWPSWWQANRAVIGDDPDLLLPGQRLVVPAS